VMVRPDEAAFIQRVRFPHRQGLASQRESSPGKRQKTGRVERMKEPYGKGVANHPDPEPYAVSREAGGGAMARARIGWVLSSAIAIVGGADAVKTGGRQHSACRYARHAGASRSRRPHTCAEPPFAGTGRSLARPRQMVLRAASQSR
jgi:hypothetical protein